MSSGRLPSVANEMRAEQRRRELEEMTPSERLILALRLGQQSLELYREGFAPGCSLDEARRQIAQQTQRSRTPSKCMRSISDTPDAR